MNRKNVSRVLKHSAKVLSAVLAGVVISAVALPPASAEEMSMALPEWSEGDAQRFGEPGSVLLGGGLWPVELQPTPLPSIGELPEGFSRDAGPEMDAELDVPRVVIHRGGALEGEGPTEEMWGPEGAVPEEFLGAYFGARPQAFLIDPQQLLSEQKTNDISRFLEYHEGESKIPIYILIFGGRQELPPEVNLSALGEQWFGDEDVVLLSYFFGDPRHSVLEFGQGASASLGAAAIGDILDSCIEEARVAENPFNQLERFCIELSIRLYWVERTHANRGVEKSAVIDPVALDAGEAAGAAKRVRFAMFSLVGCAVALGGLGWLVLRYVAFPSRTFLFPVHEIAPRLNAPHSGGAHAVMYFGKKGQG